MASSWWTRSGESDPLVAGRPLVGGSWLRAAHANQAHFEPAPSTATSATTGATLADHRTTVATVDDFFMVYPSLVNEPSRGLGR